MGWQLERVCHLLEEHLLSRVLLQHALIHPTQEGVFSPPALPVFMWPYCFWAHGFTKPLSVSSVGMQLPHC